MNFKHFITKLNQESVEKVNDLTRKQAELQKTTTTRNVAEFEIGDTVDVHFWIEIGEKGRTQMFNGTVIARRGQAPCKRCSRFAALSRAARASSASSQCIRRRLFKLEVKRSGKIRRAKLYFLRDRVGKKTRLKERKKQEAGHGRLSSWQHRPRNKAGSRKGFWIPTSVTRGVGPTCLK